MKLRTFTAPDMPTAMRMVREEMGDEAVILSTQTDKLKRQVRITVAAERDSPQPNVFDEFRETVEFAQKRTHTSEWMQALEQTLRFHNTPGTLIRKIIGAAQGLDVDSILTWQKLASASSRTAIEEKLLARVLAECFHFSPLPLNESGKRLMLVGPPGIGKTVSVAKLATQLSMQGMPLAVITCDTKRAGGIEQLAAFTDILGIPLQIAASLSELGSMVRRMPASQFVLIDTPGCNPFMPEEMLELKLLLTFPDIEPVLTMPAGLDGEEAMDIVQRFTMPSIRRLLITRLDAARRYGCILASADASGLAISHSTNTPRVVGELAPLDEHMLAQLLLQHRQSNG